MPTKPTPDPDIADKESPASREQIERDLQLIFVDDEDDELLLFKEGLEKLNLTHTVHHARSGDEMFQMLETIVPDYIFLDILLPGKSGIACLKMLRLRKTYQNVPIIIYSKYRQPSFIEDCYKAKANYYVIKSATVDKVSKAISTVLSTNWAQAQFPLWDHFLISPNN